MGSSNLAGILTDSAEQHGDRPALKLDDALITLKQLDERFARVAGVLQVKGVPPGGRVGNSKYPRPICFLDHLPKGPTGKILEREIDVPETAES